MPQLQVHHLEPATKQPPKGWVALIGTSSSTPLSSLRPEHQIVFFVWPHSLFILFRAVALHLEPFKGEVEKGSHTLRSLNCSSHILRDAYIGFATRLELLCDLVFRRFFDTDINLWKLNSAETEDPGQ